MLVSQSLQMPSALLPLNPSGISPFAERTVVCNLKGNSLLMIDFNSVLQR
jgi:hypothetical protein